MGCVSSKPPVCRNCRKPCSPINQRSRSMQDHRPPQLQGDSYHVVKLTSSTLGSLKLDPLSQSSRSNVSSSGNNTSGRKDQNKDFLFELIEAKTWSKMIDQKIPKIRPRTPVRTPPGEPEEIDAWELMEGLEDGSPLQPYHNRSFSFHIGKNYSPDKINRSRSKTESMSNEIFGDSDNQWRHSKRTPNNAGQDTAEPDPNHNPNPQSNSQSVVSDFDVGVIKTFRKTMEELPPASPFHLNTAESEPDCNPKPQSNSQSIVSDFDVGVIKTFRKTMEELPPASPFHLNTSNNKKSFTIDNNSSPEHIKVLPKPEKLIVYFTSLRGVRKTYEDCCNVLVMLKGIGIKVDERDVSMHSGFRDELKELLKGELFSLPKVFIGKQHIGGIDEIRRLNEDGKLAAALEGCKKVNDGNGIVSVTVCEGCGDVRFVPCEECSGSCKIYYESAEEDDYDNDNDEDHEKHDKEERFGFERCSNCNENGLIRCPICCD